MSKITIKQAVELANITSDFTNKLKAFSRKHSLNYKQTIIQVVASLIEVEELKDHVNQN